MKKIYGFIVLLVLVLSGCHQSKKTNRKKQVDDSTVIVQNKNIAYPHELYKVKVHKQDYAIIQRLKKMGKNAFYVNFDIKDTHVHHLAIKEKTRGLTQKQKELKIAKIDALKNYLFSKEVAAKLSHLSRLRLHIESFQGTCHIRASFPKLKALGIAVNPHLEQIYFDVSMNIRYLQIAKNNLRSINASFKNLKKLRDLNVHSNQLEDLDLSYVPWIREVNISNNPISFDKIDSLRLKYPKINIVSYSYKKKRPGNYIDRSLETPVYE